MSADIGPYIKALISQISKAIASKSTGANAYLVKIILNYGGQYLYDLVMKYVAKLKQDAHNSEKTDSQQEAVKENQENPTQETEQERRNAFRDGINNRKP